MSMTISPSSPYYTMAYAFQTHMEGQASTLLGSVSGSSDALGSLLSTYASSDAVLVSLQSDQSSTLLSSLGDEDLDYTSTLLGSVGEASYMGITNLHAYTQVAAETALVSSSGSASFDATGTLLESLA